MTKKYVNCNAEFCRRLCISSQTQQNIVRSVQSHCYNLRSKKQTDASSKHSAHYPSEQSNNARPSNWSVNDELYHLFEPCRKSRIGWLILEEKNSLSERGCICSSCFSLQHIEITITSQVCWCKVTVLKSYLQHNQSSFAAFVSFLFFLQRLP